MCFRRPQSPTLKNKKAKFFGVLYRQAVTATEGMTTMRLVALQLIALLALSACSSGSEVSRPTPRVGATSDASSTKRGAELYTKNCQSCHGDLTASKKLGKTSQQISDAIASVAKMRQLSNLSKADIQAISAALNSGTSPTSTQSQSNTGATLYANHCQSCHGALANSVKRGRTMSQIQNAIASVPTMQGLSTLAKTDIQSIASALTSTTSSTSTAGLPNSQTSTQSQAALGAQLYAQNCVSCHRDLSNSTVRGRSAANISNAIQAQSRMRFLSSVLSTSDISAIAAALSQ